MQIRMSVPLLQRNSMELDIATNGKQIDIKLNAGCFYSNIFKWQRFLSNYEGNHLVHDFLQFTQNLTRSYLIYYLKINFKLGILNIEALPVFWQMLFSFPAAAMANLLFLITFALLAFQLPVGIPRKVTSRLEQTLTTRVSLIGLA